MNSRLSIKAFYLVLLLFVAACTSTPPESGVKGKVLAKMCDGSEDTLMSDVKVTFTPLDSSGNRMFRSDSAGGFELYAKPGKYHVHAEAAYYQPYDSKEPWVVTEEGFLEQDIKLVQTGFEGVVFGGPDSTAERLAGARVFVTATNGKIQMAFTLAGGRFKAFVPPGEYIVECRHPAFKQFFSEVPIWTAPEECLIDVSIFLEGLDED